MPRPVSLPQFDSPTPTYAALDAAFAELHEAEMAYHRAVAAVRVAVHELTRSQARHVRQTEQRRDSRLAYRISEAAKLTGISESSVVRAIERGELRAVKLNRDTDNSARLILAGDLERWLAGLPER